MAALRIINQAKDTNPRRLILVKELENLRELNYSDDTYQFITRGTGIDLFDEER